LTLEFLLPALLAGGAAALLVIAAVLLLGWEASHRDLAQRVQRVVRMDGADEAAQGRDSSSLVIAIARRVGETLRDSALFSAPDIAELERATVTSGLDPRRTVPLVIGGKVLLIIACPMLAYAAGTLGGLAMPTRLMATALATAVGMLGPNWVLGWMRRSHAAALQRGLPDALDLLVVCAEAGLGLESAVDRIALELQRSNPAVAQEFASLGQELRMSADRSAALMKMGERTGLENFQRLAGTLAQTLRYGTPLGQALRVLAAEMRDERMMRLEERAARLPVLLTMPLILFILPCLFIVLGGPAAIKILNAMS
jgi:tight adherence protein C